MTIHQASTGSFIEPATALIFGRVNCKVWVHVSRLLEWCSIYRDDGICL